jgi:hypothetical protein
MVKYRITTAAFLVAISILITITLVRAEDPPRESTYYRDLTKQHFDLAVVQFEHKDVFGACSNLRISKGYARHVNDKIIYEHITLLLDKMCSGDS